MTFEALEILSIDLLDEQEQLVTSIRARARHLGIQLGWHYDLDLAWIASHLGQPEGLQVLDAGAGTGVMQWWLADRGAAVVSVDRLDRADLSGRFRLGYRVEGLRPRDLYSNWQVVPRRLRATDQPIGARLAGLARAILTTAIEPFHSKAPGTVTLYSANLDRLSNLQSDTFDAVISVSALEHNDLETLPSVVAELTRVLKPGGLFLATLAAARDADWYHEPSRGWCLTEASLRRMFALSAKCESNFGDYDVLLKKLRDSEILRDRLAPIFYESGDNGMPWGIWDPQYQPVGVRKRMLDG